MPASWDTPTHRSITPPVPRREQGVEVLENLLAVAVVEGATAERGEISTSKATLTSGVVVTAVMLTSIPPFQVSKG